MFFFIWINEKYKSVLKNVYGIKSTKFLWNRKELYKIIKNQLNEYLTNNNITSNEKLSLIIKLINDKVKENRITYFFQNGIIVSIFVPIWISYISKLFEIHNINYAVKYSIQSSFILIIFIVFLFYVARDIYYIVINRKYVEYKKLVNLLNEIYLDSL